MTQPRVLSFSQCNTARRCLRWWKYSYVDKIKTVQDTSYMDAGSVVHETLEQYYKDKSCDIKSFFESQWKKFNLDDTPRNKDEYYLMILNYIGRNIELTDNEMKIFLPDYFVGYLDGVNRNTHTISDFKTSTRSEENCMEYRLQLLVYSFLYWTKFKEIPKKCVVYYLKYNGSKGIYSFEPTADDIEGAKNWIDETRSMIDRAVMTNMFPKCKECHVFCPYKEICTSSDTEFNIKLQLVGNNIHIIGNIPLVVENQIDKKFSYELKNAHFIKKNRPGFDAIVHFYNKRSKTLPLGFLDGLRKTLNDYCEWKKLKPNIVIEDTRKPYEKTLNMPNKLIGKELRDYQKEAVEKFLDSRVGLLQLPTGSGKTITLCEIIRRLGCRTLIVVDKVDLMNQTKTVVQETLGIRAGIIGQGDNDSDDVTVATIQTLSKNLDAFAKYLSSISLVIFDESHHCSAASIQKVCKYLVNTQYRCGTSATQFRDDGNDMAITAVCGNICFSLSMDEMISNGYLMKPNIIFKYVANSKEDVARMNEESKVGLINEKENYGRLYVPFIQNNVVRNDLVYDIVAENEGKKILILTKLVEHGTIIAENIPGAIHLYGGTNKDERKDIMEWFREGKFNILVSTIGIFSEGIDLPDLDVVINGSANKGDVKSIQVLGRVLRKNEGKDMALYYDFIDEGNRFFKNASNARMKVFKKEGHVVVKE